MSLPSALLHTRPEPALIGGHEGVQIGGIGVFRQGHAGAVDEITEQGDNGHQVFGDWVGVDWVGVVWDDVDWDDVDWDGVDWDGVDWDGVD